MGEFEWGTVFGASFVAVLYVMGGVLGLARDLARERRAKRSRVFRKAMQHE